jgi:hypothetical protein
MLTKQAGPLPVGAWVAVVGTGLGIAYYSKKNKAPTGVVLEQYRDTSPQDGVGMGGSWLAVTPPTTAPAGVVIDTNEKWASQCISWLIAEGYNANVADAAMRKYIIAEKPSTQEYVLQGLALQHYGPPPFPIPSVPDAPPMPDKNPPPTKVVDPPPPPPPVRQLRIVVVEPWRSSRSTLWGMAKEFYGDGNLWRRIWDANRKGTTRPDGSPGFISNPNYLRAGDRVYVP